MQGTEGSHPASWRNLRAELADMVGEGLPDEVHKARTSHQLHATLLNWQATFLDRIVVRRRERFPDLKSDDDHQRPLRRRSAVSRSERKPEGRSGDPAAVGRWQWTRPTAGRSYRTSDPQFILPSRRPRWPPGFSLALRSERVSQALIRI